MSVVRQGYNDLYTYCMNNGERGQQLLQEFMEEKNYQELGKTMSEFSAQSHAKVWWKCLECENEWQATPHSRIGKSTGCYKCAGNRCVTGVNDLYTYCMQNGERGQQLLQEFMEEKNYVEFNKTIHEITAYYGKKIWWKCRDCGHEWKSTVGNRVRNSSNCPHCCTNMNMCVKGKNDLETWCNQPENQAWGEILLKEWDYEANAAEGNYIDNIAYGSNKRVYWICSKEKCKKTYKTKIVERTTRRRGCPHCGGSGTSYPEQFIFWSLKQVYSSARNRKKIFKSKERPQGYEYDIWIPEINTAIEYSGDVWHFAEGKLPPEEIEKKIENDKEKREKALSEGLHFIEIIEANDINMTPERENQYIIFNKNINQNSLKALIRMLFPKESKNIDFIEADKQAIIHSRGKVQEDKRLDLKYPELCKEWDYENNIITPEYYSYGSGEKVWWQCSHCGKQFQTTISSRTKQKSGCIHCGFNIFTGQINTYAAGIGKALKYKEEVKRLQQDTINYNL